MTKIIYLCIIAGLIIAASMSVITAKRGQKRMSELAKKHLAEMDRVSRGDPLFFDCDGRMTAKSGEAPVAYALETVEDPTDSGELKLVSVAIVKGDKND